MGTIDSTSRPSLRPETSGAADTSVGVAPMVLPMAGFTAKDRSAVPSPFGFDAVAGAFGLRAAHESGREWEMLGLVDMLLARERYGSVLEIGCGAGVLAGPMLRRCAW